MNVFNSVFEQRVKMCRSKNTVNNCVMHPYMLSLEWIQTLRCLWIKSWIPFQYNADLVKWLLKRRVKFQLFLCTICLQSIHYSSYVSCIHFTGNGTIQSGMPNLLISFPVYLDWAILIIPPSYMSCLPRNLVILFRSFVLNIWLQNCIRVIPCQFNKKNGKL